MGSGTAAAGFASAGGELGALFDRLDWTETPLGPVPQWRPCLNYAVRMMLPARAQIVMFWGADYVALYNDAYAPTIGDKHPRALGRPARENWAELWDDLEPLLRQVRDTGETVFANDRQFYIERHGYGEDVFFDISYSPVRDDDGSVAGILCIVSETTERVRAANELAAGRQRLSAMFEQAPGFMALLRGPDHVFELTNAAYQQLIGHRDVVGKPLREALPEVAGQGFVELMDGVLSSGEPYVGVAAPVALQRRRNGPVEERLLDFIYQPVLGPTGRPEAVFVQGQDVTDREAAQAAQREERQALEILNHTADQVAAELDLDRLVQTVTDAGVQLTGAEFGAFFYNVVDDAGGAYMLYSLSGADRSAFEGFPMPRATEVFAPTFKGEGVVRSDDITEDPRYGRNAPREGMPKGHLPVRSYLAVPVTSRSGEVIGGLFFGHSQTGMFTERAERLMTGIAAQAAVGIDNARLFQVARRAREALESQVEARTQERDRIWQVSRDMLGVADLAGVWTSVNPAWTQTLGWTEDEIVGRSSSWLVHPEDSAKTLANTARLAQGGQVFDFENRLRGRDGEYRTLAWTAVPMDAAVYAVARDVTEARRQSAALAEAEEQLRQSQKMESVGQLTGGVAHDFNNLLQVVTGNLDTLQRHLPADQPRLRRAAENAMTGARRAAILTQRLLAFARRQPLEPKPIDPGRLVAGMSELLHRTLGETIEVETVLSPNAWRVEADPNQLENAILNLALNARDAMPEGGKLTLEIANAHLDRGYTAQNIGVAPGQYVAISVSDTGVGMDAGTVDKVFEPFFTTKEVGRGTGLGLSMVYGFVKQSGGNVKVYSEPGHGTTVRLYLPRLSGATMEDDQAILLDAPEGTADETILVCEDDDDVRAYSVEMLRELGYRVLEAHDGPSALRLLERQEGRVDLLFTDVVLPGGMTGAVVAEHARRIRPGLKVLFTTGYARNAIVHHGRLDAGVELITKPFAYADLAARVRDMLDARAAAEG